MRQYGRYEEHPKRQIEASHVYRDLRDLIWPRRKLFFIGLVLVFINRAASLVLPGTTKFLIDDVVQKRQQELLIPLAAAVAGAVLVQAVTSYSLTQLLSTSAQRLIADMRIRVHHNIGRLPVRY
jgi:ABC-type bacteriocin/lantibiotic exporter with double-glycine peptidase domain